MQIEIRGLTKVYDKETGLLPTTFKVDKGEFVVVVGHNGAGKSTLLKILGGWLLPNSGKVFVDGIELKNRSAFVNLVGFVPEIPNLFDFFSVEYNLKLFAGFFRVPSARIEDILNEFELLPFRRKEIQALSKGLKQRVSIGRSLLADPPVMLFDEPTVGLDFEMTKEVYRLLKSIHAKGKTILFTSHRPEEIRSLATRILVLHQGSIVFDGPPAEYFASNAYKDLYL